jgi:type II restriction/modification system DNA methylase subunit YeeA
MNTKNLKAYAPKARRQFIDAVTKRAAHLGIYQHKVEPVQFEGGAALIEGRVFSRKQGEQRQQLEKRVAAKGYELFLREMAYTWFNRFAALRYMELHDYLEHGFRVLSHPSNPGSLPEILGHASEVADILELDKSHIIELQLAGNKEEELYRQLLLGQCHHLYKIMPFMFEQLDDATELLLPDNLTKTDSILKDLVNDIPEEDWSQIEVIGWLYQFYISEHKDAVIGKVVKSEDIPAATQLFTPNWIVKYLVQNSVGRQWLATYPESVLKGKMEYYIEPAEQSPEVIEQLKAITPTSIDPEQIKVLDPAAGSGHILVEVYEVLREVYLERGYRLREIPELILTKNIYGLDIDDRAAQLAGFALMMKAREDDRRIFQRVQDGVVALNVYSLQSSEGLDIDKLWAALDLEGIQQTGTTGGLFDEPNDVIPAQTGIYEDYLQLLNYLKLSFLQAKTLGSLIQIEQKKLDKLKSLQQILIEKVQGSDPAAKHAAVAFLPIVEQAIVLAQQYDAVIANPPYMGSKYYTSALKIFVNTNYKLSKSDLYSVFIEKNIRLTKTNGYIGMITIPNWMFLSSFEDVRGLLLEKCNIDSFVHNGRGVWGSDFGSSSFVLKKTKMLDFKGIFKKLFKKQGSVASNSELIDRFFSFPDFKTSNSDFNKIPGSPIAYWVSKKIRDSFIIGTPIIELAEAKRGIATGNNEIFIRSWHEVDISMLGLNLSREQAITSCFKWFPHNKGGESRKWYGNNDLIVNWKNNGSEIKNQPIKPSGDRGWRNTNEEYGFKNGITWGGLTSTDLSFRWSDYGALFDTNKGPMMFPDAQPYLLLGFLNSPVAIAYCNLLNPTISFQNADINRIPLLTNELENISHIIESEVENCIKISKNDWVSKEENWQFTGNRLVLLSFKYPTIRKSLNEVKEIVDAEFDSMLNSQTAIDTRFCNLVDLPFRDIPPENVHLTSNPIFRYGAKDQNLNDRRFNSEILSELVSYSIGCMMARYSLDREGLVYAQSGNEGFKDLVAEGAYQTFPADDDGIIPLAAEDWLFDDDATTRFREFVHTVWGAENLNENLNFVAESLCLHALKPKKGEGAMDTIRRYFSTQFFKDHCKTYKKRPIYWLFSSGKEKAFECLVYLHRYNEGTLARMRTEYVTPLMGKYDHQHSSLEQDILEGSTEQKRLAEKALKDLDKKQAELRTFDEQLKHHAEKRITLDLDDGVKVNYGKFGNLLADVKNIHGVAVK